MFIFYHASHGIDVCVASGGLNVIGGDTTNLVGLGGCNSDGTLFIPAVS